MKMQSYRNIPQPTNQLDTVKRIFLRIFLSLILSFVIVYFTKSFLFFPYTIENNFMEPAYQKGTKVYISLLFQKDKLLIGDVILTRTDMDKSVLLARIVGRKGDRVLIVNKKFYRNGNQINESKQVQFTDKRSPFVASFSNRDNLKEVIVKEKTYFLLVDNRDEGVDSRELGLVSQDLVIGKVLF